MVQLTKIITYDIVYSPGFSNAKFITYDIVSSPGFSNAKFSDEVETIEQKAKRIRELRDKKLKRIYGTNSKTF